MIDAEETCPRCQKCDRWRQMPDYIRDPMVLWGQFPCPPPETDKKKLLLELDWTGQLGPKYGCRALKSVAARCKVDLNHIDETSPARECDEIWAAVSICGTHCVIAVTLACICLLFVMLLVIVCVRYVKRNGKTHSPTCTKVLTTDQTALNTQVNSYYSHNQYFYRPAFPDRRGLPYEARVTDNGIEARLLKAIQEARPPQQYPTEDICTHCMNMSRNSPYNGVAIRHGYEKIYWKDRDYVQKCVPSNDSLHRKSIDRHRSITGSTSDMSHFYEYISDNGYGTSHTSTGRRSDQSTRYYPRNNSMNFKDMQNDGDQRDTSGDRGSAVPQFVERNLDCSDMQTSEYIPSNRSISSNQSRGQVYCDRHPYNLSQHEYIPSNRSTGSCSSRTYDQFDKVSHQSPRDTAQPIGYCLPESENISHKPLANDVQSKCYNVIDSMYDPQQLLVTDSETDAGAHIADKAEDQSEDKICGYKYTQNPSYDKNNINRTSPKTPSEKLEFQASPASDSVKPRGRRKASRRPSSCSNNSTYSETTSLSDSSNRANNISSTRTNGSLYIRGAPNLRDTPIP